MRKTIRGPKLVDFAECDTLEDRARIMTKTTPAITHEGIAEAQYDGIMFPCAASRLHSVQQSHPHASSMDVIVETDAPVQEGRSTCDSIVESNDKRSASRGFFRRCIESKGVREVATAAA